MISEAVTGQLKGKFGGYEIPKKFIILPEAFSLDNGMLTQTMKLIRRNVMKKYGDQLKALYE
jgi:long-chain acyl-CoA synthetase